MSKTKKTYKAEVMVLGKKYKASGTTIFKALEKLDPGIVAGKAILTVNGKERVVPHIVAKRLFNTAGFSREAAIKSMANLFEGV